MKTTNNEIIHDMHNEDVTQVENLDKIHFDVGVVWQENETFQGANFGKPYFYIKSAGIYFPISGDSAKTILAKIERLREIQKGFEEANICHLEEQRKEEKEAEMMKSKEYVNVKNTEWIFHKIDAHRGDVTTIPNDAICITHTNIGKYDSISWLEPNRT